MYIKKSLVLSATDNSSKKGICNIEKQADRYIGTLRLYNFAQEPDGILSMGFFCGDKVVKAGLTKKSKLLYSFQTNETIYLDNLSCALINLKSGEGSPLLFGSVKNAKISQAELKLASSLSILDEKMVQDKIEKALNENQIYLEEQDEIEKEITKNLEHCEDCNEKCSSCKYREAFFVDDEKEEKKTTFIDDIKEQLNILFEKYPEEEFLEQIFPNSKWAKIDIENDKNYYVVGVIYEEQEIKYVCYGVPGVYSEEPPNELKGFSKWLPLDAENPYEFGYWISYQSAENGENIEIDVI